MTDRRLGSGIAGRVFMVIDRLWRRQMACKTVQLRKCHADRGPGLPEIRGPRDSLAKIWREVDLLKDLSHVSGVEKLSRLTPRLLINSRI